MICNFHDSQGGFYCLFQIGSKLFCRLSASDLICGASAQQHDVTKRHHSALFIVNTRLNRKTQKHKIIWIWRLVAADMTRREGLLKYRGPKILSSQRYCAQTTSNVTI